MLVLGQETKVLSMNQAVSVNFQNSNWIYNLSQLVCKSRLELSSETFKLQLPLGSWKKKIVWQLKKIRQNRETGFYIIIYCSFRCIGGCSIEIEMFLMNVHVSISILFHCCCCCCSNFPNIFHGICHLTAKLCIS